MGDGDRNLNGKSVRESDGAGGSEPEHGVVYVPGCVDYLHPHSVILMAPCFLHLWLLPWHGVDNRQSLPLSGMLFFYLFLSDFGFFFPC